MKRSLTAAGFTFVEAIFTIAIIGIMAGLAMSAISNLSQDTNRIVARQQQAAVQEALTAWVMSQTRVSSTSAQVQSISNVRAIYNALGSTGERFEKLKPNSGATDVDARAGFLDQATVDHFADFTTNADRLKTAALDAMKQYLILPNWEEGSFPKAELVNE